MMMRRYIGRATGNHRGKKSWKPPRLSPLTWLILATGGMTLLAAAVLFFSPNSDIPSDAEKGSQTSSGVTPDTPTTPSEFPGTVEIIIG